MKPKRLGVGGFSFGRKSPIIQRSKSPGPVYLAHSNSHFNQARSKSLGSKNKPIKINTNPGPGQYSESKKSISRSSPKATVGSQKRASVMDFVLSTPGPGSYNLPTHIGKTQGGGNGKSFGVRHKKIKKFNVPGPGSYEPKRSRKKLSYSMNGKRSEITRAQTPPPNLGHIEWNKAQNSTFGSRYKQMKRSKTPGPGAYEIRSKVEKSKAKSFGHRTKQPKKFQTPPGRFPHLSLLNPKTAKSFGDRRPPKKFNTYPGPAKYLPRTSSMLRELKIGSNRNSPKYTLSKQNRENTVMYRAALSHDPTPGPGAYNVEFTKDTHLGKSFGCKRPRAKISDTPGPGLYKTQFVKNSKAYSFSPKRKQPKLDLTPAPFLPHLPMTKHQTFTLGAKIKPLSKMQTPGPKYEVRYPSPEIKKTKKN